MIEQLPLFDVRLKIFNFDFKLPLINFTNSCILAILSQKWIFVERLGNDRSFEHRLSVDPFQRLQCPIHKDYQNIEFLQAILSLLAIQTFNFCLRKIGILHFHKRFSRLKQAIGARQATFHLSDKYSAMS